MIITWQELSKLIIFVIDVVVCFLSKQIVIEFILKFANYKPFEKFFILESPWNKLDVKYVLAVLNAWLQLILC